MRVIFLVSLNLEVSRKTNFYFKHLLYNTYEDSRGKMMKIAMAQLNIRSGQIDFNLNSMKQMVDQAVLEDADIIVFPEMCVGGYLLSDLYLQKSFVSQLLNANNIIKSWSEKIGIIWGNISHW